MYYASNDIIPENRMFIRGYFYFNYWYLCWFGNYPVFILIIKYFTLLNSPRCTIILLPLFTVLTVSDRNTTSQS